MPRLEEKTFGSAIPEATNWSKVWLLIRDLEQAETVAEERVAARGSEHLSDYSFHGHVFPNVTGCKISWNDGCGLSLNERRTTAAQNGCHKE